MPGDSLRIGVVGIGALALRGILPHLSQDDVEDRVRIDALCDPVLERAEAAAQHYRARAPSRALTRCSPRRSSTPSPSRLPSASTTSTAGPHSRQASTFFLLMT